MKINSEATILLDKMESNGLKQSILILIAGVFILNWANFILGVLAIIFAGYKFTLFLIIRYLRTKMSDENLMAKLMEGVLK